MHDQSRLAGGVNTSSVGIAAVTLWRWQTALAVVVDRPEAVALRCADGRALMAYGALLSGAWLSALLWLADGPMVRVEHASDDPLGSMLAAVVLRVTAPVVAQGADRGSAWRRIFALTWFRAATQRPAGDPAPWAVECLLWSGGTAEDLRALERAMGMQLSAELVEDLAHSHLVDWQREALWLAVAGGDG